MKYLLETTEIYRVDKEAEAKELIENAKNGKAYLLKKYSSQYKERKQKGEVVDAYWKLSITKQFTDEKEPEFQTEIQYNNSLESAF
jgi:hypothetical protein